MVFKYPVFSESELNNIVKDARIICKIYNAEKEESIYGTWETKQKPYDYLKIVTKNSDLSFDQKIKYSRDTFQVNISFFMEAQEHNTGLNKKVCVDELGNYKHDVSHKKTFGNQNNKSLDELLADDSFVNGWKISNDKIEKCKDCQFKYMCYSCSEVEERDGKYYKVDDCNFDPYSNKWLTID